MRVSALLIHKNYKTALIEISALAILAFLYFTIRNAGMHPGRESGIHVKASYGARQRRSERQQHPGVVSLSTHLVMTDYRVSPS